jgi:hypothetical protein
VRVCVVVFSVEELKSSLCNDVPPHLAVQAKRNHTSNMQKGQTVEREDRIIKKV